MSMRVFICSWIGSGTRTDPFRSKAIDLLPNGLAASLFPSKTDGTPASTWIMSIVTADDFAAIDADTTCDDLFAGDIPAVVQTREELIAFLRGRTMSQVPVAAVLDKYGIVRTDFTGTTSLWEVFQRVTSTLLEKDDNFGSGF